MFDIYGLPLFVSMLATEELPDKLYQSEIQINK